MKMIRKFCCKTEAMHLLMLLSIVEGFLEKSNCMFICCLQQLDRQLVDCIPPAESRLQEWGRVECFDQHCLVAAKWYDNEWPRQVFIEGDVLLDVFEEEEEANLCPKDTYWDTLIKGQSQMIQARIFPFEGF